MARESKDERIVRQLSDPVTEHLHQLQNISVLVDEATLMSAVTLDI